jgi:hypothetical protein
MDDFVTVEYRGIVGTLAVGSSVVVESCDAGVLRLRVPKPKPVIEPLPKSEFTSRPKGGADV